MKIIYQAYGKSEILEQVYFSLVSLFAKRAGDAKWDVLIYTDQPGFFKDIQASVPGLIQIKKIDSSQIQKWAGPRNFVHRVKLEILQDAAKSLSETLVYCDGDTVFLRDPSAIEGRVGTTTSAMHLQEYILGRPTDPLAKKLRKFAKRNTVQVDAKSVKITDDFSMWNAGVIGLHPKNFNLLGQMLKMTDALYELYPKHVMEQLAVSFVLQTQTQLSPSDDVVYHYWDQKPQYMETISRVRAKNATFQLAKEEFSKVQLPQRIAKRRSFFQRLFGAHA